MTLEIITLTPSPSTPPTVDMDGGEGWGREQIPLPAGPGEKGEMDDRERLCSIQLTQPLISSQLFPRGNGCPVPVKLPPFPRSQSSGLFFFVLWFWNHSKSVLNKFWTYYVYQVVGARRPPTTLWPLISLSRGMSSGMFLGPNFSFLNKMGVGGFPRCSEVNLCK